MNAEATVATEGNDAKSASSCTFWCLTTGALLVGSALPVLGRPYLPAEAPFVVGALERLGLLESTALSTASETSASFLAGCIRIVGATERPLRLIGYLLLWLVGCAMAHASRRRGALSACIAIPGLFLPGAFSGVASPLTPSTWLAVPAGLLAWWSLLPAPAWLPMLTAIGAGATLALFDPLAAAVAAFGLAANLPFGPHTKRKFDGAVVVFVVIFACLDRSRWPTGDFGFRAGVPLGLTLDGRGLFDDGRLAVLWTFAVAAFLRLGARLGALGRAVTVPLLLAVVLAPLRLLPEAPDPRHELDRVTTALLPGDAIVVDTSRDAWRIYARAGHVTRQHVVPMPAEGAPGIAEAVRRVRAGRAAICADVAMPVPDCDPVGERAAGHPIVAPRPRGN